MQPAEASDPWRPTASWEALRLRAQTLRRLRQFFDERGFLEVETPILSADTVVDRHLDPFSIDPAPGLGTSPHRMWLQTSPEFGMKRLLAAGAGPIYQFSRVFRRGEQGPLHNPEFTMLEWYRPFDAMDDGMQLTSDLCEAILQRGPAQPVSYAAAFAQHLGIDPHTAETAALMAAVRDCKIHAPESLSPDDRDGWLDLLLTERVQPHLGRPNPTLLYHYPASQGALACLHPGPPPVAERFELYVDGIELANGYHELLDPAELCRRTSQANAQRRGDGNLQLPEQSRLLDAMASGLPPSVGVALGFDRLVMLLAGASSLAQIMAFPFDRA